METKEQKSKILYWVIGLLIMIMLLQGALLIHFLFKQDKPESNPIFNSYVTPKSSRLYSIPQKLQKIPRATQPQPYPAQASSYSSFFDEDPFESTFHSFGQLQQRMNQLMGSMLNHGGFGMDDFVGSYMPTVDLKESEKEYVITADLPGLEKDKINISVKNNVLTIQGVRETSSEEQNDPSGFYAQERSYGSFSRSIRLPGPVDEANVKADYKEGVLTIHLPKIPGETSTKVPVV